MAGRVKLRAIVLLRCPYCLRQPLRKPGSWFEFADGCPDCQYAYEREEGYFVGAPWMISYPLVGIVLLLTTILLYRPFSQSYGMLALAGVLAAIGSVLGLIFYPYARAIWMVGDHILHPLDPPPKSHRAPDSF